MRTASALILSAVVLARTIPAAAQTFHGGVRGGVRDATGVVPGASVQLTEQQNGLSWTTATNDRGEYAFADVLPGVYRLRVAAARYKTYERGPLVVATQAFLTVDVELAVGNISEQITVAGLAPLVETSNASVSTLLDASTLEVLPSAGRNVFFMASTRAMVLPTGDSQFVRQQDQSNSSLISIAGGPRRDNSYVLDGVPIVDILNRATFIPSFGAVEELRVQSAAYDAEVGRTSGGVFNTTARSGSNVWHGSGVYENRPSWGQGRLFFAEKNDIANPDSYFHLYGGSAGGPIVRNRTFFWASTEGYRSETSRSTVLVLPTAAQRLGDFSQAGVTIYDPLTTRPDPNHSGQFIRDPFPNNRIPANRLNAVALALVKYLPAATSGTSRAAVAQIVDRADQLTGKITHKWTDALTSNALYAWYTSMEPDARFYGQPLFSNPADPGEGALVRTTQLVALNNNWTPSSRTVVALRYGFNQFVDDNRPGAFDPSSLGFDPKFLSLVSLAKFPSIGVTDYGRGGAFLGDRNQDVSTYHSHNVSATLSTLIGRQTLKLGGEYRVNGVRSNGTGSSGSYSFTRDFTSGSDPNAPGQASGDAFASFLLGYPAGGSIPTSSPIDVYLNYWSGFAQDDIRVTPKLTLNLGLRYEFEQGLQERSNRMAVGWAFDQAFPIQVAGTRPDGTPLALSGGLVYAGVNGAPTHQGDPNPRQFAPRAGLAYAVDDRTVVRGGYGLFWAPFQGINASQDGSGTRGYNQTTNLVATGGNPLIPCATCSLTNPFPSGVQQPIGNSLGQLTGVGGSVEFVDPQSRMGHVHRYSIDVQRELTQTLAVSAAYVGARGEDLAVGGSSGSWLDINQLDPKYLALGAALQDQLANPFYGTPLAVGILASPTIARAQLLRPYSQFGSVYKMRSSLARSRYNAVVLEASRPMRGGWALRGNYTWSRTEDSQFGESNFFAGGSTIQNNYDVNREFGLSVLDTPHRLNVTGSVELPFGEGRRWLTRGGVAGAIFGGWMASAVASYESGFPLTISQGLNNMNLLSGTQRPSIVAGVNPLLTDDPENAYDPTCGCIRWLNPAAWSQAAPFTLGNAPRTDGRVRTAAHRNVDLAIQKSGAIGRQTLSVRAELINVFNFADLRGPSMSFGDASFGQIREAGGFPRMLQVVVRTSWY